MDQVSNEVVTPYVPVREKKSSTGRKRVAHPKSLPLQSDEHSPQKIRPNSVAAQLKPSNQGTQRPSTPFGNGHSGNNLAHPVLLVQLSTIPAGPEPTVWHHLHFYRYSQTQPQI